VNKFRFCAIGLGRLENSTQFVIYVNKLYPPPPNSLHMSPIHGYLHLYNQIFLLYTNIEQTREFITQTVEL